jgi:predicted RNase H-like HicB family nuclease
VTNEFTAIIEPAEEGGFWAYCPEVPGANGQGETVEETIENLSAAIELVLEVLRAEALKNASRDAKRQTVRVG